MSLAVLVFAVPALLVAGSALMVVLTNNIVRAAVWLLFTLVGTSFLYFFLDAEFLGAAQLIVYVGGTLVLVIFGVMLTAQAPILRKKPRWFEWLVGGSVALTVFWMLASLSLRHAPKREQQAVAPSPTVGQLGLAFLGVPEASPTANVSGLPSNTPPMPRTRIAYLLPFEILSVHLLVVLIGAAYLARSKRAKSKMTNDPPAAIEGAAP